MNIFARASGRVHPYAGPALALAASVLLVGLGAWAISGALREGSVPLGILGAMLVAHGGYWLVAAANVIYWTPRLAGP